MSPTQARTFHAVAIAGSFSGAAKALHVSQPTVTTQIKELEKLYDVKLFLRHARGVTLTPTGLELLGIIRRIDASQKEAVEFLLATQGLHTGHLRIGAYGPHNVIKILAEFRRRYPGPEVSVRFANSTTLQEELLNYDLDVAVFTRSKSGREFHTVPYRRHTHQVAIVAKHHPWSRRKSVHVKELREQIVIIREPGSEARRATEEALRLAGAGPESVLQIGSREGVMAAVAEGIGISTIFDEGLIPEQAVSKLPILDARIVANVDVVCLEERKHSRIIAAFFEIAKELRPPSA
jgi:LysR family transcriptional regulator, low CO2-responsive transcriptional regulator